MFEDLKAKCNPPANPQPVKVWDLPFLAVTIEKNETDPIVAAPICVEEVTRILNELEEIWCLSQVQRVGDQAAIEMKLGALEEPPREPAWIGELARIAQMPALPHQEFLDAKTQSGSITLKPEPKPNLPDLPDVGL